MLLWFVATSVATIWYVFRDPRFDYRPLIAGALLPDAVDAWTGGAAVMHSLVVAVAALVIVMLGTIGRRARRKFLLAVPIGMLLHLVFDGAFAGTEVFWWPFAGDLGHEPLPSISRGWISAAMELLAAAAIVVAGRRTSLGTAAGRAKFLRTGRLGVPEKDF